MLDDAGFREVTVAANYTSRPATPEDAMVTVTARKRGG
jgi:hypothetical protein